MRSRSFLLRNVILALLVAFCIGASAETRYVDSGGTNPVPPFTTWSTATTSIQDAVDVAGDGDLVLVTNGVYASGGRVVVGLLTNRVVVNKPLTVESVNGPEFTRIEGYRVPGVVNSNNAVRCVYLANGARLSGFTLTNGATDRAALTNDGCGGGLWCESSAASVSNCVLVGNASYWYGAGAYSGTFEQCRFTQNTNTYGGGGGAAFGILRDCVLDGNSGCTGDGGGALSCLLSNCVLTANVDVGARNCTLSNCLVTANLGNGIHGGTATHCMISSNVVPSGAPLQGGGASRAVLNECVLAWNAAGYGGGAYSCTLYGCVVSNNTAWGGGGVDGAVGRDNLVIQNSAIHGGGVLGSANLTNWTFVGNSALVNGGGLMATPASIEGCTFIGNTAGGNGGGRVQHYDLDSLVLFRLQV